MSIEGQVHFFDLHLSFANYFVSSKIYDKRDDLDIDIVNFPFWMAMLHVAPLMECIFLHLHDFLECVVM